MTLIELLMVVSIMLLLAAVALPRLRPAMESRQIRESARAIHVFLSQAQTNASRTGRPCGVLFERNEIEPNAAGVLHQVEIPPPYAGDDLNTTVTMETNTGGFKAELDSGNFSGGLIRVGDMMQVNLQGPWYEIIGPATGLVNGFFDPTAAAYVSSDLYLELTLASGVSAGSSPPWTSTPSEELPFRIYRQPTIDTAFGSIAPSMQLPRNVVVDLSASGAGGGSQFAAVDSDSSTAGIQDSSPAIMMFSPSGAIDRICYQGNNERVIAPVFLMVGRWERVVTPGPEDGLENWQDLNNLWIGISPQTGLITAAEPYADDVSGNISVPSDLAASRQFVREAQISKGGR